MNKKLKQTIILSILILSVYVLITPNRPRVPNHKFTNWNSGFIDEVGIYTTKSKKQISVKIYQ